MSIEVKEINKTFGVFKALNQVSLNVNTGELIALLGPSGSGKTTLLRIIAGLETPDSGEILFHGDDAKNKKTKDRNVGFVFQHYALFRHMTVFENIAFGLKVKPKNNRPTKEQIHTKVHELLKLIQLDWVADRYPSQLSGGQRQRVALARALAIEPKVLLLDEPFGSLDAKVRKELRQWLRRFHDDLHITTLFVTHDQEEALEVADKIVVMNEGKIEQIGSPEEVYHNPASVFVLNFLGNVNIFHARSEEGNKTGEGKSKKIYVRPHQLTVTRTSMSKDSVKVTIVFVNPASALVKIDARSEDGKIYQIEISQEEFKSLKLVKNDEVFLTPKNITYSEYDI
ncbi:MAG: sulfate ABC transporter ATP-binding protein [Candidatus Omnitrophica bacterium]|nr:sulfate ABC transporter ATP-binding protein [Candidatus Omnitrophota bacterium]